MIYTTYHPADAHIAALSASLRMPLIGGTALEILTRHFGVGERVRSCNDFDYAYYPATSAPMHQVVVSIEALKLFVPKPLPSQDDALVMYKAGDFSIDILLQAEDSVAAKHALEIQGLVVSHPAVMRAMKRSRIQSLQAFEDEPVIAERLRIDREDIRLLSALCRRVPRLPAEVQDELAGLVEDTF